MVVSLFTVATIPGATVTSTEVVPVHPREVPVIVYVVVLTGFAVTTLPVVALRPKAGAQL
jgi:hypothetical protein